MYIINLQVQDNQPTIHPSINPYIHIYSSISLIQTKKFPNHNIKRIYSGTTASPHLPN